VDNLQLPPSAPVKRLSELFERSTVSAGDDHRPKHGLEG